MAQIKMEEKFKRATGVICKQGMVQFPVSDTAIAIIRCVVGDNEDELDLDIFISREAVANNVSARGNEWAFRGKNRATGNKPCKEWAYFQSTKFRWCHDLQASAAHACRSHGIQIHGGTNGQRRGKRASKVVRKAAGRATERDPR